MTLELCGPLSCSISRKAAISLSVGEFSGSVAGCSGNAEVTGPADALEDENLLILPWYALLCAVENDAAVVRIDEGSASGHFIMNRPSNLLEVVVVENEVTLLLMHLIK